MIRSRIAKSICFEFTVKMKVNTSIFTPFKYCNLGMNERVLLELIILGEPFDLGFSEIIA